MDGCRTSTIEGLLTLRDGGTGCRCQSKRVKTAIRRAVGVGRTIPDRSKLVGNCEHIGKIKTQFLKSADGSPLISSCFSLTSSSYCSWHLASLRLEKVLGATTRPAARPVGAIIHVLNQITTNLYHRCDRSLKTKRKFLTCRRLSSDPNTLA